MWLHRASVWRKFFLWFWPNCPRVSRKDFMNNKMDWVFELVFHFLASSDDCEHPSKLSVLKYFLCRYPWIWICKNRIWHWLLNFRDNVINSQVFWFCIYEILTESMKCSQWKFRNGAALFQPVMFGKVWQSRVRLSVLFLTSSDWRQACNTF